jgi:hypothetical protein
LPALGQQLAELAGRPKAIAFPLSLLHLPLRSCADYKLRMLYVCWGKYNE